MCRAGADTEELLKSVSGKILRPIINITRNLGCVSGYIWVNIIFSDVPLWASLDIMFVNVFRNNPVMEVLLQLLQTSPKEKCCYMLLQIVIFLSNFSEMALGNSIPH